MHPTIDVTTSPAVILLSISVGLSMIGGCSSSSDTAPTADNGVVMDGDNTDAQVPDPAVPETTPVNPDVGPVAPVTSENTGETIPPNLVLTPLPDPPLTPPPGEDSEPVRAEPKTTTVTEYFALRDPVRDLLDVGDQLTDEDFAEGPLPVVITGPEGVDPTNNSPPFFVGLTNVEVFAGDELVVLYDPEDADGGLPGMFPGNLLEGASFPDNGNGTKSLRWRPLEPDVGIHEFTVTAVDPEVPQYRAEYTIRIRVSLPSDLSTIRNLSPSVNRIRPHTVRVNDPVVIYIKVGDPNGTIPNLEVLNLPAGATLTPHHDEEAITILHFVPETPGSINLDLIAIDSVDPTLTGRQTVSIEALPANAFDRPGARLRELASARDLLLGYAALQNYYERPDGAIYAQIAGDEFNIVSTENSLKFDFINPQPGQFRWAATDNLVRLAKAQRQLIHGHTLVWHRQLPPWVKRAPLEERELIMREFIDRVLARYADDIPLWDVVNESLEEDGTLRRSVWYEGMGASYIDIAFRQARESAPDATLIYNDYDIAFAGPKSDGMLALMQQLKDAGTPLDGVGFQLHLFADFDKVDEVVASFQKVANMDLDIYITELDISLGEGQTEQQQAELYEQILSACLDQPRCKAFQTWGYTDMYSWRRGLDPLILDERYQVKPAYLSLQQRLNEN
ncbi:MAG: endo-1,4-beta-xylanase [Granulosicoccus sp.]